MLALSLIFDIAVGVIILISTLLGMSRGFMREVTSLVAILGAGLAASSFGMRVGNWVSTLLPAALQEATLLTLLGGLVVFLITFFVLLLLFIPIWAGVQRSNYRGVDSLGGLLVGLIRGLLICAILWSGITSVLWQALDDDVRRARTLPLVYAASKALVNALGGLDNLVDILPESLIEDAQERLDALSPLALGESPAAEPPVDGQVQDPPTDSSTDSVDEAAGIETGETQLPTSLTPLRDV